MFNRVLQESRWLFSRFVRLRDGETLVFSIIANDFVIPAATVTWIADLAVETLSNFTRR